MIVLRVLIFLAGAVCVAATVLSAVRSVVLPRAVAARITRRVFLTIRAAFKLRMWRMKSYKERDKIMAMYGPIGLLSLLVSWLVLVMTGYVAMYWGLGVRPIRQAVVVSGSALLTLGFATPRDVPGTALVFTEAAVGLVLLAMLITYLPSIYAAFSRREQLVATLEVRAGSPPSSATMLTRLSNIGWLDRLPLMWPRWETWFIDVEETHTSFPVLSFFRSPQPEHSWITAAGTVLDAASIVSSTLLCARDPDAELCIRAGYVALRRIASFYRIPFNPNPSPTDPISVTREEYDDVCAQLEGAGLKLKKDREQAWRDFAGWRVNYDDVLVELCALVMAPPGVWSSDRLLKAGRPQGPGDHRRA